MAEVIRGLNPDEIEAYMPMREMHKTQQREIYEAVGDHIMLFYDMNGEFEGGDFLVRLRDEREVSFSCGVRNLVSVDSQLS